MTGALNPRFRFERLVVGPANQLAVTAARAVAEAPGTVYNPLYLYGVTGVGKTHLMTAVGHAVREIDPSLAVEYLAMDAFATAWSTAASAGQAEVFRQRLASVDVLLIDDFEQLTDRRDLQQELLPVLEQARQIVVAADRPPHDLEALDERLVRRCASGLVTDITPPVLETRVEIVRRAADERGESLPEETLWLLASASVGQVPDLERVVDRLLAANGPDAAPLSPGRARLLLEQLGVQLGDDAGSTNGTQPSNEFSEFLNEVTSTVATQLEVWRKKVAAAILRWEGEGIRTRRLEPLLEPDLEQDPEEILQGFARDVERLRSLEAEALMASPELAGSPIFRDPDRLGEASALVEQAREGSHPLPAPSPAWRFEDLVESDVNRGALSAARAVIAHPGTAHNPLVVVGGPGSGKTHLLHGVANTLTRADDHDIACIGAGAWCAEYQRAARTDGVDRWRARYRRARALMLDDVHRLEAGDEIVTELADLLEALRAAQGQVVVSSLVPVVELDLDPRLTTRLEAGLQVVLPPPDRHVRRHVIERLLAAKLGLVDPDLTSYLTSRPVESVRSLQGLVQRLINNAEAQRETPTVAFARRLFEGTASPSPRQAARVRSSGVVVAVAGGLRSREKMVWSWPYSSDRVIEEWG